MSPLQYFCLILNFASLVADFINLSSVNTKLTPDDFNVRELLKRVDDLEDFSKQQMQMLNEFQRYHKKQIGLLNEQLLNQKDEIAALRKKRNHQDRLILKLIRRVKHMEMSQKSVLDITKQMTEETPGMIFDLII
jgi:hypothetical protein